MRIEIKPRLVLIGSSRSWQNHGLEELGVSVTIEHVEAIAVGFFRVHTDLPVGHEGLVALREFWCDTVFVIFG